MQNLKFEELLEELLLNEETSTEVYDHQGNLLGKVTVSPAGNNYEVQLTNLNHVEVIFRNRKIECMENHELGSRLMIDA